MGKSRLEAFSDGVIAVIITIIVLEFKVPPGGDLASLVDLVPTFLSYVLSFVFVAIYWNNHHHMLHTVERVNGAMLWANLHLLFWLSLVPFATAWMAEHRFASGPTLVYGVLLLLSAIAFTVLQGTVIALHGSDSTLARAVRRDVKGKLSIVCYALGIAAAPWEPRVSLGLYVLVACMWFVPDRRIERVLRD
jgi:uncharacterized membrane protein